MLLWAADATTSTTPWWGSGLFTVIGGAIGAFVTPLLSGRNERRRARTEREAADQAIRRQALIDFLTAGAQHIETPTAATSTALFEAANRLSLMVDADMRELVSAYEKTIRRLHHTDDDAAARGQLVAAEEALHEHVRKHAEAFGLPEPF